MDCAIRNDQPATTMRNLGVRINGLHRTWCFRAPQKSVLGTPQERVGKIQFVAGGQHGLRHGGRQRLISVMTTHTLDHPVISASAASRQERQEILFMYHLRRGTLNSWCPHCASDHFNSTHHAAQRQGKRPLGTRHDDTQCRALVNYIVVSHRRQPSIQNEATVFFLWIFEWACSRPLPCGGQASPSARVLTAVSRGRVCG